ncbi:hypothetical protein QBC32DRAFT_328222 [Pseudoneurospora amorphoporcata]|uniref:Peptidase S8/S53 domain-containing protein n=1 Tax=Pseudoneurospora amorphoporcata TaxID=241081 RepID=A0AAN6NQA7_9PEZI|nr:hypothetical protein QBC32DRAFT_328222 [Pseudoneurospora amorphoporcata]
MPAPNSIRTGPPRQREDYPTRTRKGLPPVQKVLEEAKTVDFEDKKSRAAFLREFKDRYEPFIKWAFGRNSKLLECRTKHDETPLLLAIEHQNHEFVRLVLNKVDKFPKLVVRLLNRSDQVGLNCLHKAIMYASPFTEFIIAIMRKASTGGSKEGENTANDSDSSSESEAEMTMPKLDKIEDDIFTAKSRKSDRTEGWTALHFAVQLFAVDEQLMDNEEEFRGAVSRRIRQQPSSRPSNWELAISYRSRIRDDSGTDCVRLPLGCNQTGPGASSTTGQAPGSYKSKNTNGPPTEGEGNSVCIQRRDYCQLTVVRELIKANPKALITEDGKEHTPFQLRLRLMEQEAQQGEGHNEQARQPNGVQQREDEEGTISDTEEDEGFEEFDEEEEEEEAGTSDEESVDGDEDHESKGMELSRELRNDVQSPQHVLIDDSPTKDACVRPYEDKPSHDYVKEVQLINDDEVLSYIREYVIDNFDRRTAMMALYKVGCERTIEFDLSGLPYKSINKDFFVRLGSVLHFEGRLKYVALPRLTVENDDDDAIGNMEINQQRQSESMSSGKLTQRTKDLQHMCAIFEWLKRLQVKSVLKVTVMDDAELSHSDEVIETCMKDLDVRIWNWRRVDLCIDVISTSAPNVTDVTLYSSGNNAVLVGWSSKGGLPKLKELKKVRIYVSEVCVPVLLLQASTVKKDSSNIEQPSNQKLKKHKPNVKVSWGIDIPTQDLPLFAHSSSEKASREPKWMKTMKQFATFLRSIKPEISIAPIKIAIIDDGIDSTLDVFSHRIQTGESFYKAGSGRWQGAYYVPTGYHGTLMAQLICDICPVARLYIAQLEPVPRNDGRREFTQQSAIEAINWAVNRGVDIISMSWSIHSGGSTIKELESALKKAIDKKIVMFCSSIDEGPMVDDNTYPGRTGHCIKIRASTGDGARLSWVSANNSDFLLPGDESVHVKRQNGQSGTGSRRGYGSEVPAGGSSMVSTALASGLAGVLLYCDRLTRSSMAPSELALGLNDLQSLAAMRRAFKTMAAKSEDHKFLRVWKFVPLHWDSPVKP